MRLRHNCRSPWGRCKAGTGRAAFQFSFLPFKGHDDFPKLKREHGSAGILSHAVAWLHWLSWTFQKSIQKKVINYLASIPHGLNGWSIELIPTDHTAAQSTKDRLSLCSIQLSVDTGGSKVFQSWRKLSTVMLEQDVECYLLMLGWEPGTRPLRALWPG